MKRGVKKSRKKFREAKFNIRKTSLYKLLIACVIILCFLILIWVGLKISEKEEEKELRGELGELGIFGVDEETGVYFPEVCNIENFTASWESVFNEDSSGVISVYNSECTTYLLYKTNGNIAYLLYGGIDDDGTYLTSYLTGIYANLTTSSINYLTTMINNENINSMTTALFFFGLEMREGVQGYRNISNISSANYEFSNIFLIENGTWENDWSGDYFSFDNNGRGAIYKNITFDAFAQEIQIIKPINLTQIQDIEDITIYESDNSAYRLNLNDYFENLGYGDYNLSVRFNIPFGAPLVGFSYSYYSNYIIFDTSNTLGGTFTMNITLSHPDWNSQANVTTNNFNVTIRGCLDTDGNYNYYTKGTARNLSENKTDSCSGNTLTEYYCYNEQVKNITYVCGSGYYCSDGACAVNTSVEHMPSFNSTACDDLEWEVNTNYILDMRKCWYDVDGDGLTGFRYENSSSHNRNLSINQNSTNLTLIPNTNWVGEGYFYVYASDGKNESRGEIDFEVVNSTIANRINTTNATNQTTVNNDPRISSSSPSDAEVYMFPGNKTFSITAGNYTAIKWYLNGGVVAAAGGNLSYEFSNLKDGDIIKVEVINGTRIDSKTWEIKIQKDETGEEPIFEVGKVIFYLIVVIICIIILLIVWLFIIEMNKKGRETGIGFGISGSESNIKVSGGRGSSLDYFNIPG